MSDKPPSLVTRLTILCISVAVLLWALQLALSLVAAIWWQLLIIGIITAGVVVIITLRNRWH